MKGREICGSIIHDNFKTQCMLMSRIEIYHQTV